MKILASLVRWMKTGNVVLVTIAVMAFVTAALWMTVEAGMNKAFAASGEGGTAVASQSSTSQSSGWGLGLLAAALSTGISAVAAGIAVAMVGSAAMGAVAERPEVMGRSIIFVGLAEGIAIYGLIISIMILGKL